MGDVHQMLLQLVANSRGVLPGLHRGMFMRLSKLMVGLAALGVLSSAHAVDVLSESFDNVAGLSGSGWVLTNNSTSPSQAWFQGNAGVFPADSGTANSYVAASFLSSNSGAVSNWLITPVLLLDSSSMVSFLVRAAGEGFLDKIELRLSVNGASADVGSTATSVGDFGILLGSYASDTAGGWDTQSFSLVSLQLPTIGRLAFRYVVADVATAGNYIGIDSVSVTAVPEPATYALFGLGAVGLLLRRRLAQI